MPRSIDTNAAKTFNSPLETPLLDSYFFLRKFGRVMYMKRTMSVSAQTLEIRRSGEAIWAVN